MVKKTTKTRRDTRPRLNQAQLQAYRARKAETVIVPRPVVESVPQNAGAPVVAGTVSSWGHVEDEYAMISGDLKRLLIITAVMFVLIIGLWFILG